MNCVICASPHLEEIRPAEIERLEDVSFSYSFSPAHTKTFRVVRCASCTHLFCTPLPERVIESYHDVVDEELPQITPIPADWRAEAILVNHPARITAGRHLLGCRVRHGDFLDAGRAGGFWEVEWSRSCRIGPCGNSPRRGLIVTPGAIGPLFCGPRRRAWTWSPSSALSSTSRTSRA